jgi:hypothetical protein
VFVWYTISNLCVAIVSQHIHITDAKNAILKYFSLHHSFLIILYFEDKNKKLFIT